LHLLLQQRSAASSEQGTTLCGALACGRRKKQVVKPAALTQLFAEGGGCALLQK